jgi:hypothetical protein
VPVAMKRYAFAVSISSVKAPNGPFMVIAVPRLTRFSIHLLARPFGTSLMTKSKSDSDGAEAIE